MSAAGSPNEKASRQRLYLIDGSSYIFRAYHALPALSNRQGEPTGAIYGFATMLLKTLREGEATHMAVAFDSPEPTFRHKLFDAYKANRVEPPEDLKPQFQRIFELVEALNIPILRRPGWEADDLMGALAVRARTEGFEIVLVTGDKDFMQLVGPGIRMYDGMRDRWIDEEQVVERFGVPPSLVPDALALIGDASDNVPGVRGIGPKTAGPLIVRFGSVEALLDNLDSISSESQRRKLEEGRQAALLSKRLVTIDLGAPIEVDLPELGLRDHDLPRLRRLLTELEFTRLVQSLAPVQELSKKSYQLVTTASAFEEMYKELEASTAFAVDSETTSLVAMRARLVGLSFAIGDGRAWYVPVGHDGGAADEQLPIDFVLDRLRPLLENEEKAKYAQNTKYDHLVLRRHGVTLRGVVGDPMLFDYLLDPGKGGHGLDSLAQSELGHTNTKFEELAGKGKSQLTFDKVPLNKAMPYACEDADVTYRLARILGPRVQEAGLWPLYEEVEQPLSTVLAQMEISGVGVDRQRLESIAVELKERIELVRQEVFRHAGKEFTVASPKQLATVLFEDLGLPVIRRTKTGPSTDVAVLEELAGQHPLPEAILQYRQLTKLKSTYVDALPSLINPETGRLHTSYSQTTTATGRLSSSEPNLQNIPIRTEDGRRVREAFVAEPQMILISADYSQIELRVLAHLADDPALREAFETGQDVHARTASELLGTTVEKVSESQRRVAKAINFGILYGMSPFRLARDLGIDRDEAKQYIDSYFQRHRGVASWIDKTVARARERRMVTTILGRRRLLPEIDSKNYNVGSAAERMALNTPIQGSAADIIKLAMLRVHEGLGGISPRARLILQVHDELVIEAPKEDLESLAGWLRERMETAIELLVPLKVEVGWGETWALAH